MEDVENEKRKAGNESAWQREYLLKIVSTQEQPIHREWIQYYNVLPPKYFEKKEMLKGRYYDYNRGDYRGELKDTHRMCDGVRIGIDLAISEKDTADYTAMVPAMICGYGDGMKIFILPKIINQRATFPDTVELCKTIHNTYFDPGTYPPYLIVEDVGYQRALPQQLEIEGEYKVGTVRPLGDKRGRLALTANLIKSGKILFPKEGAEELIEQIVHFGVEKHDDLADAFSIVILHILDNPPKWFGI
jgi:predicted phage terminase large subunit-like protein